MTNIINKTLLAVAVSSVVAGLSWAGPTATPKEAAVTGIWKMTTPAFKELKDANGKAPPLNEDGKKLYAERKAKLAKGDKSFDLSEKCKPMGFPRVLWDGQPFDMQVNTDKQVFQSYSFNRNHRLFVKWSDKLPRLQIPRYYGTSAAQWDGDALVIRSGMYNENSMLDSSGLPLSDSMVITERYIPSKDGKKLEVRLNIDDERYYSKPWDVSVKFEKVPNGRIPEDVCQLRSEFYKTLIG
ncbi:MAG: hypothetical protein QM808_15240 [Steroidobacteraceae bacterium]